MQENTSAESTEQPIVTWVPLQQFSSRSDAMAFYQILCENLQSCFLVEDPHQAPDSFNLKQVNLGASQVVLEVYSKDLDSARRILELTSGNSEQEFTADDYLTHFSDEDLKDILRKPDEWSLLDYDSAIKLLSRRGIRFSSNQLQQWKEERMAELEKPAEPSTFMLIMGYLSALLGGMIGLLMAWQLGWHQKRLPDGRLVPTYTPKGLFHARIIAPLSLVGLTGLAVLLWLMN